MEGVFHEMKDLGYPIEYVEREEFARAFAMAQSDPVSADVREKDFEELNTGGMGIKLAKMYSNDMIYARTNGRNVLTMKFNIKNKS